MIGVTLAIDSAIRFCPYCQSHVMVSERNLSLFRLRLLRFVRIYLCQDCRRHFPGLGSI